jgi:hypothetical protein
MAPSSSGTTNRLAARRAALLLLIALPAILTIVGLVLFFFLKDDAQIRNVRDILLILLALEFMVVGIALTLLMIQLARLSMLIELEVRPMVHSAEETLRHLSGTAHFLDENLVNPIVKLNGSLAGIQRVMDIFHLFRRKID